MQDWARLVILQVFKKERVLAKIGRFEYAGYLSNFIKNCHHRRPFNVVLTSPNDSIQRQLLKRIPKNILDDVK